MMAEEPVGMANLHVDERDRVIVTGGDEGGTRGIKGGVRRDKSSLKGVEATIWPEFRELYFFFFSWGRSQLQHEVKKTRLQKESAGQRTENKVQRTKNKKTGETGEGK